jgi:hypothetical protein
MGLPVISAEIENPQRYFYCLMNANRLLGYADMNPIDQDARVALVSCAYLLLWEGAAAETQNQLMAFVNEGHDDANAATAASFLDPQYLVDGVRILESRERGVDRPHVLLRRLRNAIAHGRVLAHPTDDTVAFVDVSQGDANDRYELRMHIDGLVALVKQTYMRTAVVTAYVTWLLLWTMTSARVPDVFDTDTLRVHQNLRE